MLSRLKHCTVLIIIFRLIRFRSPTLVRWLLCWYHVWLLVVCHLQCKKIKLRALYFLILQGQGCFICIFNFKEIIMGNQHDFQSFWPHFCENLESNWRCTGTAVEHSSKSQTVFPWQFSFSQNLMSFFLLFLTDPAVYLAPVVQRLDNAICWINRYPADKCQQNQPRYPLDSDLSGPGCSKAG